MYKSSKLDDYYFNVNILKTFKKVFKRLLMMFLQYLKLTIYNILLTRRFNIKKTQWYRPIYTFLKPKSPYL